MSLWNDHGFPNFEVIVCQSHGEVCDLTDFLLSETFTAGARNYTIGVGRTQYPMFDDWKNGRGHFVPHLKNINFVQGDDYVGLDKNDPRSLANVLRERLGKRAFKAHQFYGFNRAMSPAEAAIMHERNLATLGGLHVFCSGVGGDEHVLFNNRGSSFESRTRVVKAWDAVNNQNNELLGNDKPRPTEYITMGLGEEAIGGADTHIISVSGKDKAPAMQALFHGPVTEQSPITYLRNLDPDTKTVKIVADQAAMSLVL